MTLHAVIYARFSTDRQRETSIEDQARVCRARAAIEGWQAGELFSDMEVSGQTIISQRPGAASLLKAIQVGGVDVLLIESLDRLARDLVEQEQTVRRLEHQGLRIVGVSDGYDTAVAGRELMRGVRGLINESYIRDLRTKTHRGLAGQIARGFHAGGISYGYRSIVANHNARGEPVGHRLEIDVDQARWVRWIFEQYAGGATLYHIVDQLNRLQVPSPGARRRTLARATWCVSALFGSPEKGSGILNNEIYIGRYIWNRSEWRKDPDTRRRTRMMRPREEWQIQERSELRIIDADTWQRVRVRMDAPRLKGGARGRGRPARTLFGGLLKCGICGGAVVALDARYYGCAARKDRGPSVCAGMKVDRALAEKRLLSDIRQELLAPATLVEIRREISAALSAESRKGSADEAQNRLAAVQREIRNLTEAIATVGLSEALRARLAAAEAELKGLQRNLAPAEAAKPTVERIMSEHKRGLVDLRTALKAHDIERTRTMLRRTGYGDIVLKAEGAEIYALLPTASQLLLAAAGHTSKSGCGDRI